MSKGRRKRATGWSLLAAIVVASAVPAVAEEVDLAAFLTEAEANHPEIKALTARRAAAATVPSQAETLPDPTFSASYTNESLSSFTLGSMPDSNLTLSWTQEVPYPGKRRLAGAVAQSELATVERQLEWTRLRVRSEVKRRYFELHRLDRTATVLAETRAVLASFVDAARARYESGGGPLENVLKAQTELAAIEIEFALNRQERRTAEARMTASLGRGAEASFGPVQDLPVVDAPDRAWVEARAVVLSPEVKVLEAMADADNRRFDLAKRNLKPDLMYGAGYAYREDLDPMVMGMIGIRLPLYRGRKQAQAAKEAELRLEAARHDLDLGRIATVARIRELLAQFDRATALVPLYSDALIPLARSTLDAAAGSYVTGGTDFLALLDDALKVLRYEIEVEQQRVQALEALVGAEEASGVELILPETGGPR